MFELKKLSREAVPAALAKAERYRLLNEPVEAESICRDVLEAEPENQGALVTLILALSDQVRRSVAAFTEGRQLLARLAEPYARHYYDGILCERRAKAALESDGPGSGRVAYEWLREAMHCFEAAAELRPPGNDDALLRFNTCVRIMDRNAAVEPAHEEAFRPLLE